MVLRETSSVNHLGDSVLRMLYRSASLALTLAFSNHCEFHAQGVQDGVDRFKAWVRSRTQGFVEAFSAQARVFGDLRYASCLGHVAQGCDEYLGVRVFGSRRKIFRDDRVVIKIRRRVEWLVNCFLFFHSNFA